MKSLDETACSPDPRPINEMRLATMPAAVTVFRPSAPSGSAGGCGSAGGGGSTGGWASSDTAGSLALD